MIRFLVMGLIAAGVFGGCSAKEFNAGMDEATDGVVRVIRGTNN